MSEHLTGHTRGQMPEITRPDFLDVEVLGQLPNDRFDPAPGALQVGHERRIAGIDHVGAVRGLQRDMDLGQISA
jgi:hypothetical protein